MEGMSRARAQTWSDLLLFLVWCVGQLQPGSYPNTESWDAPDTVLV